MKGREGGEGGEGGMKLGEEGNDIYISSQTKTSEEKGEPKRIRTEIPLLASL